MADSWHYELDGKPVGPVETLELRRILSSRSNPQDALVWGDGFTDWQRAGEVQGLLMPSTHLDTLRKKASEMAARGNTVITKASEDLKGTVKSGMNATTSLVGEAYTTALNWKDHWKNNSELSQWLTDHFSHQAATIGSKAMDAEYLRTHVGGGWHRLYDGGHTLAGSWRAVNEAFPDSNTLDVLGTWANEYWKDLITARGMPIVLLDHSVKTSEWFKHIDCVNVAELIGMPVSGISIYSNWNDSKKLVAAATSTECSGLVYANVVAPLITLIGLGRAYFLLRQSEEEDLRDLIAPALKGLTRSGASILLITVLPGGFLLHLSSGIVISVAHNYVWDKGNENKEVIFSAIKECLQSLGSSLPERRTLLLQQQLKS